MTIHPVPKPEPTTKSARKRLQSKTPLRSTSSLSRQTPITKRNQARLDKRTKAYRAYMASDAWRTRRVLALIAAEYRCARCGFTPPNGEASVAEVIRAPELHVHHLTYARFGHEEPDDLEVICSRCHEQEHAGRFIRPRGLRGGRN